MLFRSHQIILFVANPTRRENFRLVPRAARLLRLLLLYAWLYALGIFACNLFDFDFAFRWNRGIVVGRPKNVSAGRAVEQ